VTSGGGLAGVDVSNDDDVQVRLGVLAHFDGIVVLLENSVWWKV
jgi:hypothetical protein